MRAVAGPRSRSGLTPGTGGSPIEPGPASRATEASAEALPGPRGRSRPGWDREPRRGRCRVGAAANAHAPRVVEWSSVRPAEGSRGRTGSNVPSSGSCWSRGRACPRSCRGCCRCPARRAFPARSTPRRVRGPHAVRAHCCPTSQRSRERCLSLHRIVSPGVLLTGEHRRQGQARDGFAVLTEAAAKIRAR